MYTYPEAPPQRTGLRRYLWKKRMWIESTFVFGMLQTWEVYLVWSVLAGITILFWASVMTLYPRYFAYLSRRFSYYVFEDETISALPALREWIKEAITGAWRDLMGILGQGGSEVVKQSSARPAGVGEL